MPYSIALPPNSTLKLYASNSVLIQGSEKNPFMKRMITAVFPQPGSPTITIFLVLGQDICTGIDRDFPPISSRCHRDGDFGLEVVKDIEFPSSGGS